MDDSGPLWVRREVGSVLGGLDPPVPIPFPIPFYCHHSYSLEHASIASTVSSSGVRSEFSDISYQETGSVVATRSTLDQPCRCSFRSGREAALNRFLNQSISAEPWTNIYDAHYFGDKGCSEERLVSELAALSLNFDHVSTENTLVKRRGVPNVDIIFKNRQSKTTKLIIAAWSTWKDGTVVYTKQGPGITNRPNCTDGQTAGAPCSSGQSANTSSNSKSHSQGSTYKSLSQSTTDASPRKRNAPRISAKTRDEAVGDSLVWICPCGAGDERRARIVKCFKNCYSNMYSVIRHLKHHWTGRKAHIGQEMAADLQDIVKEYKDSNGKSLRDPESAHECFDRLWSRIYPDRPPPQPTIPSRDRHQYFRKYGIPVAHADPQQRVGADRLPQNPIHEPSASNILDAIEHADQDQVAASANQAYVSRIADAEATKERVRNLLQLWLRMALEKIEMDPELAGEEQKFAKLEKRTAAFEEDNRQWNDAVSEYERAVKSAGKELTELLMEMNYLRGYYDQPHQPQGGLDPTLPTQQQIELPPFDATNPEFDETMQDVVDMFANIDKK